MLIQPSITQAVLKMLSEIGSVDNIPEFIEGVKARLILPFISSRFLSIKISDWRWFALFSSVAFWHSCLSYYSLCCLFFRKRKLSGFGHRVYKNYDPRAKVLKKLTEEVFSIVGRDPLIEVFIHFVFPVYVTSVTYFFGELHVCCIFLKLDVVFMRQLINDQEYELVSFILCRLCSIYLVWTWKFYVIIWLCRLLLPWRRLLSLMSILSRGSYIQMLTSTLD